MRILFLSSEFPNPWDPGKAVFNLELVRSLAEEHEIRAVCPVAWTDQLRASSRSGDTGSAQAAQPPPNVNVSYPRYWHTPGVFRHWYGHFFQWSVSGALRRVLDAWRPDVVLSYWAHPDGYVAARLARRLGVPSALITGGSDLLVLKTDARRSRMVQETLEQTDLVFAVSEHLKTKVIECGIPPERVAVLRRGVDTQLFSPGSKTDARSRLHLSELEPILLWVGRFVRVKGVDALLSAFARVGRDARLYLVGEGPERRRLQELATALNVASRVVFVGPIARQALPDWYRAADLTVLSSRSEGLPNVLLESVSCGTPFVATDVGGVCEIADPEVDALVPPGDIHALATALTERLEKPRAARRTVTPTSSKDCLRTLTTRLAALTATSRRSAEMRTNEAPV